MQFEGSEIFYTKNVVNLNNNNFRIYNRNIKTICTTARPQVVTLLSHWSGRQAIKPYNDMGNTQGKSKI